MKTVNAQSVLQTVHHSCPGLEAGKFNAKSSFRKHGLDSMDIASLLLALEESHGIKIPDQDVDKLDTVEDIVAYLAAR